MALGGRAAEELFVGKISTGASDDLDKADPWVVANGPLIGREYTEVLRNVTASNMSQ